MNGSGQGDMLDSRSGEDIVLAGSTIYDNNAVARQAIESDWSTNYGTFLQRVAALPSPSGIKGGYELCIPTVTNTCGAIAMTSRAESTCASVARASACAPCSLTSAATRKPVSRPWIMAGLRAFR